MKTLKIDLLGPVNVHYNDVLVTQFASRKALALLVYLVGSNRPVPREHLATLLWPNNDESRALANLSVALASLRKHFPEFIAARRHTIALVDSDQLIVDSRRFIQLLAASQAVTEPLRRRTATKLAEALVLYKGEFLEGFRLRDTADFEMWLLLEQERFRQLALDAGNRLVGYYRERRQYSAGIELARRLIRWDPLDESRHRELMRLLAANGQSAQAIAQYESCCDILQLELGVEPDEETSALIESIRLEQWSDSSPDVKAHNLPAATGRFIGRNDELAKIAAWVHQDDSRLLTLLGPGGMGKTRLALQALQIELGNFVDGVWYLSLVGHQDSAELPFLIANELDLQLGELSEPTSAICQSLADKELLLLLDNFETILDDLSLNLLVKILATCPDIKLLTTSRQRLNLAAEQILLIDGLPTSTADSTLPPATQLFSYYLHQNRSDFALDLTAREQINKLGQLLGGHPLALQLAASWTATLPLTEILSEIVRDQRMLTTTAHDTAPRHRSIEQVFSTTWAQLSAEEQRVYSHLSVFKGGFTRQAAREQSDASFVTLEKLVSRALLRLDNDDRYRRHPLLLQFSSDRLAENESLQQLAIRTHVGYFVAHVSALNDYWPTSKANEATDIMRPEWANIQVAITRAAKAGWFQEIETIWDGVQNFLWQNSRYLEGSQLLEGCLSAINQHPDSSAKERILTILNSARADFWQKQSRYQESADLLASLLEPLQRFGLVERRLMALMRLSEIIEELGERQEAFRYMELAVALAEEIGDETRTIVIKNSQANLYTRYGRYQEAEAIFLDCLAIAQRTGSEFRVAVVCGNLGITVKRLERYTDALKWYGEAERLFAKLGHHEGVANCRFNRALVLDDLGQYAEGLVIKREVLASYRELGLRAGEGAAICSIGFTQMHLNELAEAEQLIFAGLEIQYEVDMRWSVLSTINILAQLAIRHNDYATAIRYLAFVAAQDYADSSTSATVNKQLEELEAELPTDLFSVARDEGEAAKYETFVPMLLAIGKRT